METVADKRIEKALLYITTHFEQALPTKLLADSAGMSLYHFHRNFLKQTGETPAAYILRLRMEHATHLIRLYPHKPLVEIALLSGYSTPAEFSRVFRKYFGYSARDFKKQGPVNETDVQLSQKSEFSVFFLKKQLLSVYPSNLTESGLRQVFDEFRNNHPDGGVVYTVLVDAPFHTPPEKCRFYLGQEKTSGNGNLSYELAEGYYTSLEISGDFNQVLEQLIAFKLYQLDASPYEIASVTAFEKLTLPPLEKGEFSYFGSNRQLFIRLQRK